jgi:TRAP-type C4-dicarboxylate transport system permease large subunit
VFKLYEERRVRGENTSIAVLVMEMAVITPPVVMNVYAIAGIEKEGPLIKIFNGVFPFIIVMLILIAILIFLLGRVLFLSR